MPTRITGANELARRLSRMVDHAKELDGRHNVPLTDLFPEAFVQEHSHFETLAALLTAAAAAIGKEEIEGADLAAEEFSQFIAGHTDFDGWTDMVQQGATEYFRRKLLS